MLKIIEKIKKVFKPEQKQKEKTLQEMEEFIKNEYHYNNFQEELIDEIYSNLLKYGSVKVSKKSNSEFIIELTTDEVKKLYKVNYSGFEIVKSEELK